MPGLDSYLVTLGIKGQAAVLSTMEKIRKIGGSLSKKKTVVDLISGQKGQKLPSRIPAVPGGGGKSEEKENDTVKRFSKSVDKFGGVASSMAHAAARLDPAAMITSGLSALGKISIAGIPFNVAEAAMNMATNTVNMAKSTASSQYGLEQRNATAGYYGSNVFFSRQMSDKDKRLIEVQRGIIASNRAVVDSQKKEVAQESTGKKIRKAMGWTTGHEKADMIKQNRANEKISAALSTIWSIQSQYASKWSNEEMANLRTTVGASFVRIHTPLAEAINEFTSNTNKYNAAAVTRVAGGNWRSTGTDRGWMLQQMMDSMGDVPPSIAQRFQASLLKRYGAQEIQQTTETEKEAQIVNAEWGRQEEEQIRQIFGAIKEKANDLLELNENLNSLQVQMVSAGAGVASALNIVAGTISTIGSTIRAGK